MPSVRELLKPPILNPGNGVIGKIRSMFSMPGIQSSNMLGTLDVLSENERIVTAQRLYDYYSGDVAAITGHVSSALGKTFTALDISEFQFFYLPVLRRIIDKLSVVYKCGVWRTLESDTATDSLADLYERSDIQKKQRYWLRYAKLFHTVLVQPVVREIRGEKVLNYDIHTPNKVSVVERADNYLLPEVVSYKVPVKTQAGTELHQVVWTDTEHYVLDAQGRKMVMPGNELGINPYKQLPFVVLRMKDTENFWGEGETLLAEVEEKVSMMLVQLMDLIIMQSHGQPVFTNVKTDSEVQTGPRHAILLNAMFPDQQASFEFASPNGKIADVMAAIDWTIERVCVMYGLAKTSESSTGQVASGYAKMLDNWDLLEQRAEDVEILKDFEKELYQVTAVVCNKEGLGPLPEEGFNVEFDPYEIPQSPQEVWLDKDKKYQYGLWTPADDLMEQDKSLTREQAEALIAKNVAARNRVSDRFSFESPEAV